MDVATASCRSAGLGIVPYADALDLQKRLVEERKAGGIPDQLLLLQHPPVITLGVKARNDRSHVLASPAKRSQEEGVEIFETGRGGDVTYHGPGQLVGYPILDLRPDRCDVSAIRPRSRRGADSTAAAFGVTTERIPGAHRVWAGQRKARGNRRPHLALDHQPRLCVQCRNRPRVISTSSSRAASRTRASRRSSFCWAAPVQMDRG